MDIREITLKGKVVLIIGAGNRMGRSYVGVCAQREIADLEKEKIRRKK